MTVRKARARAKAKAKAKAKALNAKDAKFKSKVRKGSIRYAKEA